MYIGQDPYQDFLKSKILIRSKSYCPHNTVNSSHTGTVQFQVVVRSVAFWY
jgi:hypothetical protein